MHHGPPFLSWFATSTAPTEESSRSSGVQRSIRRAIPSFKCSRKAGLPKILLRKAAIAQVGSF